MEKIIRKDGYVYLEKWHDVDGRHKTIYNLGKEYVEKEANEEKPKRMKRKKSN
jgi:hypothetical protein